MKLISFSHMRVRGIFISQRNCLLEIAGGLKANRLKETGCGKVKSGKLPGLSAIPCWTHVGKKAWGGHKIHHSEQILFSVCDYPTGCRAAYNNVRAILGTAKRLYSLQVWGLRCIRQLTKARCHGFCVNCKGQSSRVPSKWPIWTARTFCKG